MARTKKTALDGGAQSQPSISGISREWDKDEEIKARLLEGGNPLHPKSVLKQEDNRECILNKGLLRPCLERMSIMDKRPIPAIDSLRDEVSNLLVLSKRTGPDTTSVIEETSQTIKKLLVFVKAKVRRKEVSTASWLNKLYTCIQQCQNMLAYQSKCAYIHRMLQNVTGMLCYMVGLVFLKSAFFWRIFKVPLNRLKWQRFFLIEKNISKRTTYK